MNTAILFDTMSIQQYVFGSNKLRDNLGASYIVEHVYKYLEEKAGIKSNELDIGYVGGGNALFFTTSEEKAKETVKEFTTEILWKFPGLSVATAIKDDFINEIDDYQSAIQKLFQALAENKGKHIPINTISSHGINDVCRFSSLPVENIQVYPDGKIELMSSLTAAKRLSENEVRKLDSALIKESKIPNIYQFADELDHLGQKKGEDSHVAVVHIDGNGFGKHFIKKESVRETKELSEKVKKAVNTAFIHLLSSYSENEEKIKHLLGDYNYYNNILPIRPIILGGDDITFVCHGKLGIWFAEKFMEHFNSNFIDDEKTIPFSSCAGVAIVKTKYPFYRAYQLAEELCENAKKMNKKHGGNWIDFQLAYSGLGNTLEEVRKLQYLNVKGIDPLHNRPYCLEEMTGLVSVNKLKEYTATLKETLPNSKIKDLREMLTRDVESQKVFIEHLKNQHNEKDGFKDRICKSDNAEKILVKYPFFDMIELLELYPTNLLNE